MDERLWRTPKETAGFEARQFAARQTLQCRGRDDPQPVPMALDLHRHASFEDLINPAGTVHGGLTATLLDSCMGLAVHSTLEKGLGQTTLEFKISLVRPLTPEIGTIRAEGTVVFRGRRVGTVEGRLTDSAGRIIAHGTTTCLIFED